ncbi:MAG: hypothetical protein A2017_09820 [Lentisphaerae bacterium GWF2_44_16]|nr:MAG: hypothetical protein A2017_09820 [Lentisphaerae bacterium GWF2_44_16]
MLNLNTAMISKKTLEAGQRENSITANKTSQSGTRSKDAALNTVADGENGYYGSCNISQFVKHYDEALEKSFMDSVSENSYMQTCFSQISNLENTIAPNGKNQLNDAVRNFAAALQTAASSTEAASARTELIASTRKIADTFNREYNELAGLRDSIAANNNSGSGSISNSLSSLKGLLEELPAINDSIQRSAQNGSLSQKSAELREKRDDIVNEASKYINLDVTEESNSKYTVFFTDENTSSSCILVDGKTSPSKPANYLTISMNVPTDANPHYSPQITFHDSSSGKDSAVSLSEKSGQVKALADVRTYITGKMDSLYAYSREFGDANSTNPWRANRVYSKGESVASDGYAYKCTTGGASGSAQPSWNSIPGAATNDGGAVWTTEEFSAVNASHMEGYDLDGNSGGKIFDANSTQPSSGNIISVSLVFASNPRKAALSPNPSETRNSDNVGNMLNTMNNPESTPALNGESILSFPESYASAVSEDLRNTEHATVTSENIEKMFQSAVYEKTSAGMDNEMTNMLSIQKAYQAAAKLINVLEQMSQTVLAAG